MQLTKFTDFGLRVLISLAARGDGKMTVVGLAEDLKVSRNHLVKVVNKLSHLGYVETTRGVGGGVRLAREPGDIRLGAVVRDIEANMNLVDCGEPPCPLIGGCRLVSILKGGSEAFLSYLDGYTLGDLVDDNPSLQKALFL